MRGRRVLFLGSGRDVPATLYRILPYLPRLRSAGFQCDLAQSVPGIYDHFRLIGWRTSQQLRRMIRRAQLLCARIRKYDAIVLSRELFNDPTWEFEEAFRALTGRFVLDVDDAVFQRFPEKFERNASMSDVILAGNSLLADFSRQFCQDVRVLPSAVDLNEYPDPTIRPPHEPLVIGWIGTASNLPFLQEALPALEALSEEHSIVLRIVTNPDPAIERLREFRFSVEFHPWSAGTAVSEVADFDIGIMPLPENQWTRYKCGFKLLQYMAAGVPAVASPVGVNSEIISPGESGFLAGTTQEWTEHLAALMTNASLRRAIATRARERIADSYSVEACLPILISALNGP